MKQVFIYTLSHPITNEIRYIGKTVKNLSQRLKNHIWESKKQTCHRHNWINKLLKEGLKPKIELIDVVHEDNWIFWEMYWIEQFKAWNFNLINETPGGDGYDWTGRTHKNESKEKMSKAKKGLPTWNKGKNLTKKHKNKLSKAHSGKKLSKSSIEKRSEKRRHPIALLDSNKNIIKEFSGIVEARNYTGVDVPQIKKLIQTGNKSKRGYFFKYL